MKEIVFSDSAKGALKIAQRYNAGQMCSDGPTAFIGERPSEEELRRMWDGQPVGGDPGDVLGLSFSLDVGDISGDADSEMRTAEIRRLWGPEAPEDALREFMKSCSEDLKTAKAAARRGEKLRVWVSGIPSSACGLRHLLWEIRDCGCPVTVVELPRYWEKDDRTVTEFSDWCEVMPGHFAQFLPLERPLGNMERRVLSHEWAEAVRENAPLRAVVNGRLMGVGEDFYDPMLRGCMTVGDMHMGRLLGEVLGKYQIGVGDGWFALRIHAMIERGELEIVEQSRDGHPYSMKLRKS